MQKYRIFDSAMPTEDAARHVYRGTQDAAKKEMQKWPTEQRHDIRVQLVEVRNDSKSVEDYLNGLQPDNLPVLNTWRGSPRGGLVLLRADGTDAKDAL